MVPRLDTWERLGGRVGYFHCTGRGGSTFKTATSMLAGQIPAVLPVIIAPQHSVVEHGHRLAGAASRSRRGWGIKKRLLSWRRRWRGRGQGQ